MTVELIKCEIRVDTRDRGITARQSDCDLWDRPLTTKDWDSLIHFSEGGSTTIDDFDSFHLSQREQSDGPIAFYE
jgi:hypothetical protein